MARARGERRGVRPLPEGRTRGVDFACVSVRGQRFYVEARGRLALSLTGGTGIEDGDEHEGGCFDPPAKDVCAMMATKESQAAKNIDAPVLVAVGSLHRWAGLVTAPSELGFLAWVAAPTQVVRCQHPDTGAEMRTVMEADHYAFAGTRSVGGLLWLPSQATWPGAPVCAAEFGLSRVVNTDAYRPSPPARSRTWSGGRRSLSTRAARAGSHPPSKWPRPNPPPGESGVSGDSLPLPTHVRAAHSICLYMVR